MEQTEKSLWRATRNIYITQVDDIQCDLAQKLTLRCADQQHTDALSQELYPALWRHFQLCVDCYEEYRLLMEMAQSEPSGEFDCAGEIPSIAAAQGQQSSLHNWLARATERSMEIVTTLLFPGFQHSFAGALRGNAPIAPVVMETADGRLRITLFLANSGYDATLRMLTCQIEALDASLKPNIADATVRLITEIDDEVEQEETLDDDGSVVFDQVSPAQYRLEIKFFFEQKDGQPYVIEAIHIGD